MSDQTTPTVPVTTPAPAKPKRKWSEEAKANAARRRAERKFEEMHVQWMIEQMAEAAYEAEGDKHAYTMTLPATK